MKAMVGRHLKGRLAAFLSIASREFVAVIDSPRDPAVAFVGMPPLKWNQLTGNEEYEAVSLEELKYELSCGYVGYVHDDGTSMVYQVAFPRTDGVIIISESRFRQVSGEEPGPFTVVP